MPCPHKAETRTACGDSCFLKCRFQSLDQRHHEPSIASVRQRDNRYKELRQSDHANAARLELGGLGTDRRDPVAYVVRHKLRAIVRSDIQLPQTSFSSTGSKGVTKRHDGLISSYAERGRNLPCPGLPMTSPLSTTMTPREMIVSGQPVTSRPS